MNWQCDGDLSRRPERRIVRLQGGSASIDRGPRDRIRRHLELEQPRILSGVSAEAEHDCRDVARLVKRDGNGFPAGLRHDVPARIEIVVEHGIDVRRVRRRVDARDRQRPPRDRCRRERAGRCDLVGRPVGSAADPCRLRMPCDERVPLPVRVAGRFDDDLDRLSARQSIEDPRDRAARADREARHVAARHTRCSH